MEPCCQTGVVAVLNVKNAIISPLSRAGFEGGRGLDPLVFIILWDLVLDRHLHPVVLAEGCVVSSSASNPLVQSKLPAIC